MSITITVKPDGSVEMSTPSDHRAQPDDLTNDEEYAVDLIRTQLLAIGSHADALTVEQRSSSYLSLCYKQCDFMRMSFGPRVCWFSLQVIGDMRKKFFNDARFDCVKDKNLLHWRIDICSVECLDEYLDLIEYSYNSAREMVARSELIQKARSDNSSITSKILYKPNGQSVQLNDDELRFNSTLCEIFSKIVDCGQIHVDFMADNIMNYTILKNPDTYGCQIGRVRLRGRAMKMQILTKRTCKWPQIHSVEEALALLPKWAAYYKSLSR